MATIPVYLTDDDGNLIEQASGSGDYIIVGYINQTLFANASGELYTTFYDVVQAATPEQKAEVLRGLRLAKGIRGDLRRFELSGSDGNAYVKYNHSIFGGRYQSQYTALGTIAGTYLRRGGSAFTKELVEAALVSGPYANFSNFPSSPVLPGDIAFSVAAGGGNTITYSWSITDSSNVAVAIADPTASSVTVNLSEDTYNVSCAVSIDGTPIVLGDTVTVAEFSASSLVVDDSTPATDDIVAFSYAGTTNPALLGSTDWTVERFTDWRTVPLSTTTIVGSIELPATENVDYEIVSQSATELRVRFLTGGSYHVSAVARNTDNTVAVSFADLDVEASSDLDMSDNHYLSAATADALVGGDCHMIILGDSMMNPTREQRLRHGLLTEWKPARWAGITHGTSNNASWGNIDTGITFNYPGGPVSLISGDNVKRDGTGGGGGTMSAEFAQVNYLTGQGCTQFTFNGGSGNFFRLEDKTKGTVVQNQAGQPILTGRMQDQGSDTFYNLGGLKTKAVFYADDAMTIDASIADGTASSVSFGASSFGTIVANRTPSGAGDRQLNFSSPDAGSGDKIGYIDGFTYNPNVSGFSISYMGDGGWNTANHLGGTVVDETGASALSRMTKDNEWYDDVSIQEHLKLVAYKDDALTTLRGKIVILVESQNVQPSTYDYVGQMNLDLLPLKARWEAQADIVDPSGDLKDALQFVVVSLHQANAPGDHFRHSAYLRQVIGKGGYSDIEFIDMTQEIADTYPGLEPKAFVDNGQVQNGMPAGTATDPALVWYDGGDNIHTTAVGSRAMMKAMWDVIVRAATPTQLISGNVTADPVLTQVGGAIEFDVDNVTGDTDRVIVWLDQNGNEVARGENPTLNNLAASVTRVDARIITADGGDTTLVGPSITINNAPTITSQLAIDGGTQPVTGTSYDLVITATDVNGDNLTYTLSNDAEPVGPLSSGAEASFTLTAGAEAVDQVFTCTVTDGNGGSVTSSSVTVTPASANQPPVVSSFGPNSAGPYTEGDVLILLATPVSDPEGQAMTYTMSYSLDGGSPVSIPPSLPGGVVTTGVAVSSVTVSTAGDYEFELVVTDAAGASTTATSTITVDALPSDPFGTADYIVDNTIGQGTANGTETIDNIGINQAIKFDSQSNSIRVRLKIDGPGTGHTDAATMETYLSNNPNAVFVVEYDTGVLNYYEWNQGVHPSALNWSSSMSLQDLWGNGWRNENGTSRSGPSQSSNTFQLRIYPGT